MSNFDAGNKIFEWIGKKVDLTLKKGGFEGVKITEVLRNKITLKPSTVYFVTNDGKKGFVNFEDIRYCLEAGDPMEEVNNPESLNREIMGVKTYNRG